MIMVWKVVFVHAATCLRSEHPWECSNWVPVLRCFPTEGWFLHRRTSGYILLTSACVRVDPPLNNGKPRNTWRNLFQHCSAIFSRNDLEVVLQSQINSVKCGLITCARGLRILGVGFLYYVFMITVLLDVYVKFCQHQSHERTTASKNKTLTMLKLSFSFINTHKHKFYS